MIEVWLSDCYRTKQACLPMHGKANPLAPGRDEENDSFYCNAEPSKENG